MVKILFSREKSALAWTSLAPGSLAPGKDEFLARVSETNIDRFTAMGS